MRLWLRSIFRRSRVERDLDDELSFHMAMETSVHTSRGLDPTEARRRARRSIGGYEQVKEACRDTLRMGWLDTVIRDVRHALRSFRRNPTFTLVALLSLAIGVGANCAAFTWADALLIRPLPIPRPSEVMTVGMPFGAGVLGNVLRAAYPEYVEMRDRVKSFDGLLAFSSISAGFAASRDEVPKLKLGAMVSGNFFDVLRLTVAPGRTFRGDEDAVRGRDAVIILSHRLWQGQFAADSSILGKQVFVRGVPFTVVGVAPAGFTGLEQFVQSDFYVPLMMWDRLLPDAQVTHFSPRDVRDLIVKGRLTHGASVADARAELTVVANDLARAYPDTNRSRDLEVWTEFQTRVAQIPVIGTLIALLTTLAAAVLFVACANMAGLLTSRGPARAREMAVRSAIGAGRSGLVRQMMTENFLLAIGGGILGVAVGYASMRVFRHVQIPTDLPIGPTFDLDRRTLAFSLIVATVSALLFGLAPAVQISRVDLTAVMKGADNAARARRTWGRGLLVTAQVAVSVVLLAVATFAYRAFRQELVSGPGYRLDHLLMLSIDTGLLRYSESESSRFYERLLDRVREVAGVRSATLTSAVPMQTSQLRLSMVVPDGFIPHPGRESVPVMSAFVDEHFFSTIRIPIVSGRDLGHEDSSQAPPVVVVNELFAQHHWPGQDPLGRHLRILNEGRTDTVVRVVGVAKNSKYMLLAEPPTEYLYLPFRQDPSPFLILLTQSDGDPSGLATPLRSVVRSLDPNMPVFDVHTMQEFYDISTVGLMNTIIGTIAAMGTLGLALSLVGLYGLVAYAASRRTKEIGIRMALGADRMAVLSMVMKQGVLLSTAGLAIGLLGSAVAGELLAASFVGPTAVGKRDFTSLLLVASAVLVVTGLAAYLPARRASRTDPVIALRYE